MVNRIEEEKEFVATVTLINIIKSTVEGIPQQEYHLRIVTEDNEEFEEWIPISLADKPDLIHPKSILNYYIRQIERIFPQAKDITEHEGIIKLLLDKKLIWVKKPIGEIIMGVPPKVYYIPKRVVT